VKTFLWREKKVRLNFQSPLRTETISAQQSKLLV